MLFLFFFFFLIFPEPKGLILCGSFGGRCAQEINAAIKLIHSNHRVTAFPNPGVDRDVRARRRAVLERRDRASEVKGRIETLRCLT